MGKIDEAAILRRAKELCTQDEFAWELDFTVPYPRAGHLRGSLYPNEERRQHYLALARAEMTKDQSANDA
jgi:hypothetical protein